MQAKDNGVTMAADRLKELQLAGRSSSSASLLDKDDDSGGNDSPMGIPPQRSKPAVSKPDPKAKPFMPGRASQIACFSQRKGLTSSHVEGLSLLACLFDYCQNAWTHRVHATSNIGPACHVLSALALAPCHSHCSIKQGFSIIQEDFASLDKHQGSSVLYTNHP